LTAGCQSGSAPTSSAQWGASAGTVEQDIEIAEAAVAIVDAGGHLIAFARQDGALIGSIDLAIYRSPRVRFSPTRRSVMGHKGVTRRRDQRTVRIVKSAGPVKLTVVCAGSEASRFEPL
jgi:hypothetical protein